MFLLIDIDVISFANSLQIHCSAVILVYLIKVKSQSSKFKIIKKKLTNTQPHCIRQQTNTKAFVIAYHLSDHSQGTLFHAGNHQHIQWESIWPHCQCVNTQARWRLQGFLASVKGRWDHSKGTLLPAGWPQWKRWPVWDLTSLGKMERTVPSINHKFPASACVFALCFHIHMCTCADVCICVRPHTISFLFVYYAVMFVCLRVCEFTPAFFFVLSTVCTKWTTYHTKAKELTEAFSYG